MVLKSGYLKRRKKVRNTRGKKLQKIKLKRKTRKKALERKNDKKEELKPRVVYKTTCGFFQSVRHYNKNI